MDNAPVKGGVGFLLIVSQQTERLGQRQWEGVGEGK